MEYKTEGCSLTVPDKITVRKQVQYSSAVGFAFEDKYRLEAWWEGAKVIIEKWDCELIKDHMKFDMDKATDPEQARIVGWAGVTCWQHMQKLDEIPKK